MKHLLLSASLVLGATLILPVAGWGQIKTKPMTHEVEGKENCVMCHTPGVIPTAPDIPESHEGRGAETCLWCHGQDAAMVTQGASQFAHDLEGRENCILCHTAGMMPEIPDMPESHKDRAVETCLWCHTKIGPGME